MPIWQQVGCDSSTWEILTRVPAASLAVKQLGAVLLPSPRHGLALSSLSSAVCERSDLKYEMVLSCFKFIFLVLVLHGVRSLVWVKSREAL